jgi:hypothetical protein
MWVKSCKEICHCGAPAADLESFGGFPQDRPVTAASVCQDRGKSGLCLPS